MTNDEAAKRALRSFSWAVAAFVAGSAAVAANEPRYDVVDLGTLGGATSSAVGINTAGEVAGEARNPSSVQHAVLWLAGQAQDLGAPEGFIVSSAVAVNDAQEVAGNAEGDPQAIRAYIWESGSWTPLGTLPDRSESKALDINARRQIVGWSLNLGAGDSRAFLWEDGTMLDLGTLGGETQAHGINDREQIVGWSGAPEGTRAFVWEGGKLESLGVLDDEEHSQAFGVNVFGDAVGSSWHVTIPSFFNADQAVLWRARNGEIVDLGRTPGPERCTAGSPFYTDNVARSVNRCGQVVGHAQCVSSGSPLAAFLWDDGAMHNLNDLIPADSGWDLIRADDINEAGQVVGVGVAPSGDLRAFLLEPRDPGGCFAPALELDEDRLDWTAEPGASSYDVVRGDVASLRDSQGDFALATSACVADNHPDTMLTYEQDPSAGTAWWFSVRWVGPDRQGPYDSAGTRQLASRDPGIRRPSRGCP